MGVVPKDSFVPPPLRIDLEYSMWEKSRRGSRQCDGSVTDKSQREPRRKNADLHVDSRLVSEMSLDGRAVLEIEEQSVGREE